MMMARIFISSVTGTRSSIFSNTGRLSWKDVPKLGTPVNVKADHVVPSGVNTGATSKHRMPPVQIRYCCHTGLSRCHCLRISSIVFSLIVDLPDMPPSAPTPTFAAAGSPGASLLTPKEIAVMTISVGMNSRMRFRI